MEDKIDKVKTKLLQDIDNLCYLGSYESAEILSRAFMNICQGEAFHMSSEIVKKGREAR